MSRGEAVAQGESASTFERMDRMYRPQKLIYDLTRAYYLLGRDRKLAQIQPAAGDLVLDIGCGTARNLRKLAGLYPQAWLAGLDPSDAMLEVARQKLGSDGLAERIDLYRGVTEDLGSLVEQDSLERPQHILFSYSLSIMPDPVSALASARASLAPGGSIHIVDFGPMDRLPDTFRKLMRAWLAKFHVHPRPLIAETLKGWQAEGAGKTRVERPYRGYCELLTFQLAGQRVE